MIVVEGKAFLEGGLEKCCIGMEDGRITAIKKILKGDERFDYGDNLVLPGCIDAHVHLREPGKTTKEDFYTGTLSAAFGGVTCAVDMPNNDPPMNTLENLMYKLDLVEGKANVDFGLYSALTRTDEIEGLSKTATGFKVYMAESTDTEGINTGHGDLEGLLSLAPAKSPVSVHCEDDRFMKIIDEKSLEDHLSARPDVCEVEAIKYVCDIARKVRRNVHIAHVSSAEGVRIIEKNKKEAQNMKDAQNLNDETLTSEVTVSHMLLNTDSDLEAFGKVNPPLRRKKDNEALRSAFSRGDIDILVSDHAPHTVDEKEEEFSHAPSGIPGVETNVPIVLNLVKRDLVSLKRFVEAAGTLPARLFGLKKGMIEVGYDGDLIVVDMKDVKRIKVDDLHSKCSWTPYENYDAVFPKAVFLRGNLLVEDSNLVGERNGRFVGGAHIPV